MTVSVCMRDSEQHSMVGLEARWAGSLRRGVFTNRKSPATSRAGGHRVEATLAGDLLLLDPDPGAVQRAGCGGPQSGQHVYVE